MKIGFIGNCQMVSLCYFLQQLCTIDDIRWICYENSFIKHLGEWSKNCNNKITNIEDGIQFIKECDILFFQHISVQISPHFNYKKLIEYNNTCIKYSIPTIYLDINNYDNSYQELKRREYMNKNDITVSDIFDKFISKNELFYAKKNNHPTTIFFMEIMKKICILINHDFFNEEQYLYFLSNTNNIPH